MATDIRAAIVAAAKRKNISTNELAAAVDGHIHRSHVYDFIAGRKELTTDKAGHLLRVLGLKVR